MRTWVDGEGEQDLRDMQEAVFAGTVDVDDYKDAMTDYCNTRFSRLYIKTKNRRRIIWGACLLYVGIIAYGRFHYLLPWHVAT